MVIPEKRPMDWSEAGFDAFGHFDVNAFTNREWGDGHETEQIYNSTNLGSAPLTQTTKSGVKN